MSPQYSICSIWRFALLSLRVIAPAVAAEKITAPQLIELAKSNPRGLGDAITATFNAKDLQDGTAWVGRAPDFFFAIEVPSAPSLVIDDASGPQMQHLPGSDLWYTPVARWWPGLSRERSEDQENDRYGSGPLTNIRLANALKLKGYDFHLSFGKGTHNSGQGAAEFPQEMIWLWRDYDPAKTEQIYEMESSEKSKPLFRVSVTNRDTE